MTTRSDELRFYDVRDAYRLIGECRDLGADPVQWQTRLAEGLCSLAGAPQAVVGEGRLAGRPLALRPLTGYAFGLDTRGQEALADFHRTGFAQCPIFSALRVRLKSGMVTHSRTELVPDRIWYRSESYRYRSGAGADHVLTSVAGTGTGMSGIALLRAVGERDFSARERRVLHFLHGELRLLVGRSLASVYEQPQAARLAPRLSQTLACLLEGDSEKQVASRLSLSQPTVHQYVTALYRRFGVCSRAQLLAFFIRKGKTGSEDLAARTK